MNRSLLTASCLALASFAIGAVAQAQTYTTSTSVTYFPMAPESNFGAPTNLSSTTNYTVRTGIDANNFYVDVTATPPAGSDISGLQFSNIYLGGIKLSPGLIFEVTNNRVSTTSAPGTYFSLSGTGFTFNAVPNDISFSLPLSFVENDPLGIGFTKQGPGDQLRVSYSQSFGYSFNGGPTYNSVTRLGAQTIPGAPAPEPSTWAMLGLGVIGAGIVTLRRRQRAA